MSLQELRLEQRRTERAFNVFTDIILERGPGFLGYRILITRYVGWCMTRGAKRLRKLEREARAQEYDRGRR